MKRRIVELVRSGRSVGVLAREFEVSEQSVRNWVKQADVDEGRRGEGLTTEVRAELRRLKRENKRLRMERDIPKKAEAWFAKESDSNPGRGYEFMKAHQAEFPVAAMCRVLRLSRSGYYDWLKRPSSERARRDLELQALIVRIWSASRETYGSPRVHAALQAEGEWVSRKRVARLMRALGIRGVTRRRPGTTPWLRESRAARCAPDLMSRDFTADGPDQLWAADFTHVRTWNGWLFLAIVLDVWSRRIVGWATGPHPRTQLVQDALAKAISNRKPRGRLVHHSDQGVQYMSLGFGKRCREAGIVQSMGSPGNPLDNAMCESFFASLECELIARTRFYTRPEAHAAIAKYIEDFYNVRRIHSGIGDESPADFEKLNHAA